MWQAFLVPWSGGWLGGNHLIAASHPKIADSIDSAAAPWWASSVLLDGSPVECSSGFVMSARSLRWRLGTVAVETVWRPQRSLLKNDGRPTGPAFHLTREKTPSTFSVIVSAVFGRELSLWPLCCRSADRVKSDATLDPIQYKKIQMKGQWWWCCCWPSRIWWNLPPLKSKGHVY